MAIVQVNFVSKALFRTVTFQAILPVDKFDAASGTRQEQKPFKTLYLLNGLLGNYTDWVTGTRIQRWAEERDLAVIMPSGENSFYLDKESSGNLYGQFIGQELVEISRKLFPLSHRREDTFIGGLSMGGFGAIRNGLKYHETFGHIIGFSSALHILEYVEKDGSNPTLTYNTDSFGPLKEALDTDKNPRFLIKQLKESGAALPRIYLSCGTEDRLLGVNRRYRDLFKAEGFDLTYYEGPGDHDWDFWDQEIRKVMDWLPLDHVGRGTTSGSVGN